MVRIVAVFKDNVMSTRLRPKRARKQFNSRPVAPTRNWSLAIKVNALVQRSRVFFASAVTRPSSSAFPQGQAAFCMSPQVN